MKARISTKCVKNEMLEIAWRNPEKSIKKRDYSTLFAAGIIGIIGVISLILDATGLIID